MSELNFTNLIPRGARWRRQVEDVLASIVDVHPKNEVERHVSAMLQNHQYHPVMIIRTVHEGAYGDHPHFNIKTQYSAEIHVYVYYHKGRLHYAGMTG